MGTQHKDHPKHKDIDTFYLNKMLHLFHLLLACVGLAATAPSSNYHHGHEIQCRTEYITLSTTEYEDIETKECKTKWVPVCKTYTETECSTEKRKVCEKTWEGEGENMKWVDIPGTCEYQPHDECKDVTKEQCTKNAKKMCEDKHKRIPVRVSKRVPKKVCDEDDGYTNPNISEYDEYELEATSGGLHKKNKKHSKDSDEDSSDEKKDSDEDSSDEEKERKKHKKHKKHSDEDDD